MFGPIHAVKAVEIVSFNKPYKNILIFSDSKSLVDSINNLWLSSQTLLKIWNKLKNLKGTFNITFSWVRGHTGVLGNELADSLAKDGVRLPSLNITRFPTTLRSSNSSKLNTAWNQYENIYKSTNQRKRLLLFSPKVSSIKTLSWINFSSPSESHILTGHGNNKAHLFRINRTNSDTCRYCQTNPETIDHILFNCQALLHIKYQYPPLYLLHDDPVPHPKLIQNKTIWCQTKSFISSLKL